MVEKLTKNIQTKKYTQCLFLLNENDFETFLDFIQKAMSFNVQLKIKKKKAITFRLTLLTVTRVQNVWF